MSPTGAPDRETVVSALNALDAAFDEVAGLSFDALTHAELLSALDRIERLVWRAPSIGHPIIARLTAEASPVELGATSLTAALAERLRISRSDARRRIKDAAQLGPRRAMSGEALAPKLTHTAAAQAHGQIGPEHVRIVRKFFDELPDAVDHQTREAAEADLARIARGFGPEACGWPPTG